MTTPARSQTPNPPQARLAIVGAGAVGASLAAMFLDGGVDVTILAEGDRAERLRQHGLHVNGVHYDVAVDEAPSGEYDLVFVATKSMDLPAATPLIRRATGTRGHVVSLLNGITSESILAEAGLAGRVVPAMIIGIDAVRSAATATATGPSAEAPTEVRYLNRGTIHFGSDPQYADVSPAALDALTQVLSVAGIPAIHSVHIVRTLWWKFMINVGINQTSAVLRAPYGVFQRSHWAQALMHSAMREVIALSREEATGLCEVDIAKWDATLATLDPAGKTSMLQDVEAGRPTEVDIFAGTVLRLAQKHHIAAAVNETLYYILRAGEERAEGASRLLL